jgi:NAD(P)-dependent dehydrogenase (short-subunit alcohol dehydrogenase family)
MNPIYDFTGQGALVTGASAGIGSAAAKAFAVSGTAVVFIDINADLLNAAVESRVDRPRLRLPFYGCAAPARAL